MGKRRGFTLIEAMISIAILAIFLAIPMAGAGVLNWLSPESAYRFALRNGRHQLEALRKIPLDQLPPQSVSVGADGWIQLGQSDLVPDSVRVAGQTPLKVDAELGRVQVSAAVGSKVIVDYRYYVPDEGEAHTVPAQAPFRVGLKNGPVARIVRVLVAQGDKLTAVPKDRTKLAGDLLELPAELAGKVVVVDYRGDRIKNEVEGHFLDADLHPAEQPTRFKLMRVHESYGANSAGKLTLSLVKS